MERAPTGQNRYFVNDREVDVNAYLAITARARHDADQAIRSA